MRKMNRIIVPAVFGFVIGGCGCHSATVDVPVKAPEPPNDIVGGTGPCTEDGVSFVESRRFKDGMGYRKCWSSKIKRFVSEIYQGEKIALIYMIPTLPRADEENHYSAALDNSIQSKLRESGADDFTDKESIGRVKFVDLNFDGHLDALIYKGTYEEPKGEFEEGPWDDAYFSQKGEKKLDQLKFYDGLLWDAGKRRFMYENDLHSIVSPVIDDKNRIIRMMRDTIWESSHQRAPNVGESDFEPDSFNYEIYHMSLRHYREFVELKYESGKYLYHSAVTFVSCGEYTEEIGTLSIIGSHTNNKTCLYSEYDYPNNEEHRIRAYVPVEELSRNWADYIRSLGERK